MTSKIVLWQSPIYLDYVCTTPDQHENGEEKGLNGFLFGNVTCAAATRAYFLNVVERKPSAAHVNTNAGTFWYCL